MPSRLCHRQPRRRSTRRPSCVAAPLERRLLLAAPVVDPIAPITVPAGRTYQVPVTSTFDGPGGVSFRTSTSAGLSASVRPASNSWLDLKTSVGGFRFQLFDDAAPKTVRRFKGLVQSGFFNGLTFHRVISNLLAQGGDPAGNGTGGAESRFDDEFNPDLQFTGSGQLAMADVPATASGIIKDQNSSQFFVTRSPQRDLDYNFTLFGQLVTGFDKLKKLTQVQVQTGTDTPVSPPIIHRASIVTETRAAVVQLKANDAPGTRQLTVTAVGPDGAEQSRTVTVTVEANVVDAPPILSPIADVRAAPGSTVTLQLSALDLDGDDYTIGGEILSGGEGIGGSGAMLDQSAKTITLSLQPSFTGAIQLRVGVKQAGAVTRGSIAARPGDPPGGLRIYDTQVVTIAVGDRPLTQAQGIAAYYNEASQVSGADLALASFVDEDAQATEGDFSVAIDWGDGTVDDEATVEAIAGSPGTFRVVGRHAYPDGTTGSMPVSVYVVSTKGVRTTIDSSVVLNPTASFENGVVSVFGADIADEIDLYLSGTELRALVNGKLDRFTLSQVSRVEVRSFAGDDRITAAPGVPGGAFYAGAGNDTVRGTDYGDSIEGGDGRDYLDGGPGNDVLFGEGDNDTLTAGAGKNTLYGGDGDDRMNGSGGRDLAYGGDGNDRLYGNGGSDTLDGQSGSDRLWGGDGDDLLVGSGSIDRLWGNAGNDTLHGGTKTEDVLDGGDGTDTDGDQDDKDTLISIEA